MAADQYVVVTRYALPDGKEVVHVYGSWPTRARAETQVRQMKRQAAEYYTAEECAAVTYCIRKVLVEPPD